MHVRARVVLSRGDSLGFSFSLSLISRVVSQSAWIGTARMETAGIVPKSLWLLSSLSFSYQSYCKST